MLDMLKLLDWLGRVVPTTKTSQRAALNEGQLAVPPAFDGVSPTGTSCWIPINVGPSMKFTAS